ncbi:MAG: hypothetical protein U1D55_08485 [Phycisphaerae bacterium]
MDAPARQTSSLLLDTNVLLLLGVGLTRRSLVGKFKGTAEYQPRDFDRLRAIANGFERLVTIPHVLAEFSNLFFRQLKHGLHEADALDAIRACFEFHVAKKSYVNDPDVRRFGFTDAAIAWIAEQEGLIVATVDAALTNRLESRGLAVINLNHLRSEEFLRQRG